MDRKSIVESRRREICTRIADQPAPASPAPTAVFGRERRILITENLRREGVVATERILAKPDLLKINFLYRAAARSAAVGRIAYRNSDGSLEGFATGFLIGPQLMMTNNHVFKDQSEVEGCVLQMMYEDPLSPTGPAAGTIPILRLIDTNPELDMSLLEVGTATEEGHPASDYGWIHLEGQLGKLDKGWAVNIIQHPDARTKEISLRDNEVLDIKGSMLEYKTDTEQGSSGSPVFNDMWQLVALHSTGVPDKNAQGLWKSKRLNDYVDPATITDADVVWRANGGFRVSDIYAYLKKNLGSHPLVARALSESPPTLETRPSQPAKVNNMSTSSRKFTIPLTIEVSLGTPTDPSSSIPAVAPVLTLPPDTKSEEAKKKGRAPRPLPLTEPRNGFSSSFLGHEVPMPGLANLDGDVLRLLNEPRKPQSGRSDATELKYFNASIFMSASRKIALFTAANGGVENRGKTQRGDDSWFYDDRIDRDDQLGNYIYAGNDFDRGHLNRRDDLDWGVDQAAATQSNDDTFFWTNCSPQHTGFNQSSKDGLWGALEEFVSSRAGTKVPFCIFNGPVLSEADRVSKVDNAIKVPSQFWKVVVVPRVLGAAKPLSVTAFLLDQSNLILNLTEKLEFDEESVSIYQVTLDRLEELTKLDFSALKGFEASRPLGRETVSKIVRLSDVLVD